jgi:hypothetical protein
MREHRADSRGIRVYGSDGFVLDCVCGWPASLQSSREAAARSWVAHVRADADREALAALRAAGFTA